MTHHSGKGLLLPLVTLVVISGMVESQQNVTGTLQSSVFGKLYTVTAPEVYSTAEVPSLSQCSLLCLSDSSRCQGFSIENGNGGDIQGVCRLHTELMAQDLNRTSVTDNATVVHAKLASCAFSPCAGQTDRDCVNTDDGSECMCQAGTLENAESECEACWYSSTLGRDYFGTVNTTAEGIECQRWDTNNDPHSMTLFSPSRFPEDSISEIENYCRNPDDTAGGPWCYTKDPGIRWRYCDVPSCIE